MGKRFLISRLSAMGDVVCSLPAASALKRGFPNCAVVWACDPRFAEIVRSCSAVDEVVKTRPRFSPSSWKRMEGKFDAALDLQGLLKSAWVIARAKAPLKLGYHWQREGAFLFSARVEPDPSSVHVVDQYVDVARAAGGIAHRAEFALTPSREALESIRGKLAGAGVVGPFVAVNPGAAWATKRPQPLQAARWCDEIAALGRRVVLIGGPSQMERENATCIADAASIVPANLVGATTIAELIALISLCDAHVGGDTGSTHLSAALGRPAIGLYSVTKPERSCPYGQKARCIYEASGVDGIDPAAIAGKVREALC